jgi:hypothetical protein
MSANSKEDEFLIDILIDVAVVIVVCILVINYPTEIIRLLQVKIYEGSVKKHIPKCMLDVWVISCL